MRIPYSWIRELVETDLPPEMVAHTLTMGGLEVEEIVHWCDPAGGPQEAVLSTTVTSNRGDLLSVVGTARQLAALLGCPAALPTYAIPETIAPVRDAQRASLGPLTIEIKDVVGCPRYSGLLLEGVSVSPSPDWLRRRLEACGIRAINNVVDCTNYILAELGQPLHAFDLALLADGHIIVRRAHRGETMTTLDGVQRVLTEQDLLICDPRGPVALAGVMGGAETEISAASTTVLLEAAHFDPATIRRTSSRLGLSTEASYRFERHVDPNLTLPALARAAELIIATGGGRIVQPALDIMVREFGPRRVSMRAARCNAVLGASLSAEEMSGYLRRLQLEVQEGEGGSIEAIVPTFRPDLEREIDLVEEVAILHGYAQIPSTIPGHLPGSAVLTPRQRIERRARQILRACGLNETLSFSMTCPAQLTRAACEIAPESGQCLVLASPMSDEYCILRTTLLPSLLGQAQHNVNQRTLDVALFEVSPVFLPQGADELPLEPLRVAGIIMGSPYTSNWRALGESLPPVDFFWLKAVVEQLCDGLGIENTLYLPTTHPSFAAGCCAQLLLDGASAGVLGQVTTDVQRAFDLPQPAFAFELDFEMLAARADLVAQYRPLPRFPAALRDVAVIVPDDDNHSAARLSEAIRQAGGELLSSVEPFDIFADPERFGPGRKSIAFRLKFRAPDRALSGEELDERMQAIHGYLEKEMRAVVRSE